MYDKHGFCITIFVSVPFSVYLTVSNWKLELKKKKLKKTPPENYTTSGAPAGVSVPIVHLVVGKTLFHKGIVIVWWITMLNAFVNKPYNEKTWLSAGAHHLLFDKHFS